MHINGFTTQATVLRRLSGHPRFRAGSPPVDNTCAPLVASVVRGEACRRSPRWLHWKDIVEPIPPELGWIWRQGNRTNERHRLIQSGSEMPRGPAALIILHHALSMSLPVKTIYQIILLWHAHQWRTIDHAFLALAQPENAALTSHYSATRS